ELAWVAYYVNSGDTTYSKGFAGYTIILRADINLGGKFWAPIGTSESPFCGKFVGNGHIISGITFESASSNGALFGYTKSASIQDVIIQNTINASYGIAYSGDGSKLTNVATVGIAACPSTGFTIKHSHNNTSVVGTATVFDGENFNDVTAISSTQLIGVNNFYYIIGRQYTYNAPNYTPGTTYFQEQGSFTGSSIINVASGDNPLDVTETISQIDIYEFNGETWDGDASKDDVQPKASYSFTASEQARSINSFNIQVVSGSPIRKYTIGTSDGDNSLLKDTKIEYAHQSAVKIILTVSKRMVEVDVGVVGTLAGRTSNDEFDKFATLYKPNLGTSHMVNAIKEMKWTNYNSKDKSATVNFTGAEFYNSNAITPTGTSETLNSLSSTLNGGTVKYVRIGSNILASTSYKYQTGIYLYAGANEDEIIDGANSWSAKSGNSYMGSVDIGDSFAGYKVNLNVYIKNLVKVKLKNDEVNRDATTKKFSVSSSGNSFAYIVTSDYADDNGNESIMYDYMVDNIDRLAVADGMSEMYVSNAELEGMNGTHIYTSITQTDTIKEANRDGEYTSDLCFNSAADNPWVNDGGELYCGWVLGTATYTTTINSNSSEKINLNTKVWNPYTDSQYFNLENVGSTSSVQMPATFQLILWNTKTDTDQYKYEILKIAGENVDSCAKIKHYSRARYDCNLNDDGTVKNDGDMGSDGLYENSYAQCINLAIVGSDVKFTLETELMSAYLEFKILGADTSNFSEDGFYCSVSSNTKDDGGSVGLTNLKTNSKVELISTVDFMWTYANTCGRVVVLGGGINSGNIEISEARYYTAGIEFKFGDLITEYDVLIKNCDETITIELEFTEFTNTYEVGVKDLDEDSLVADTVLITSTTGDWNDDSTEDDYYGYGDVSDVIKYRYGTLPCGFKVEFTIRADWYFIDSLYFGSTQLVNLTYITQDTTKTIELKDAQDNVYGIVEAKLVFVEKNYVVTITGTNMNYNGASEFNGTSSYGFTLQLRRRPHLVDSSIEYIGMDGTADDDTTNPVLGLYTKFDYYKDGGNSYHALTVSGSNLVIGPGNKYAASLGTTTLNNVADYYTATSDGVTETNVGFPSSMTVLSPTTIANAYRSGTTEFSLGGWYKSGYIYFYYKCTPSVISNGAKLIVENGATSIGEFTYKYNQEGWPYGWGVVKFSNSTAINKVNIRGIDSESSISWARVDFERVMFQASAEVSEKIILTPKGDLNFNISYNFGSTQIKTGSYKWVYGGEGSFNPIYKKDIAFYRTSTQAISSYQYGSNKYTEDISDVIGYTYLEFWQNVLISINATADDDIVINVKCYKNAYTFKYIGEDVTWYVPGGASESGGCLVYNSTGSNGFTDSTTIADHIGTNFNKIGYDLKRLKVTKINGEEVVNGNRYGTEATIVSLLSSEGNSKEYLYDYCDIELSTDENSYEANKIEFIFRVDGSKRTSFNFNYSPTLSIDWDSETDENGKTLAQILQSLYEKEALITKWYYDVDTDGNYNEDTDKLVAEWNETVTKSVPGYNYTDWSNIEYRDVYYIDAEYSESRVKATFEGSYIGGEKSTFVPYKSSKVQDEYAGSSFVFANLTPTRPGYTFAYWGANGSGDFYKLDEEGNLWMEESHGPVEAVFTEDLKFYAYWNVEEVDITCNGATHTYNAAYWVDNIFEVTNMPDNAGSIKLFKAGGEDEADILITDSPDADVCFGLTISGGSVSLMTKYVVHSGDYYIVYYYSFPTETSSTDPTGKYYILNEGSFVSETSNPVTVTINKKQLSYSGITKEYDRKPYFNNNNYFNSTYVSGICSQDLSYYRILLNYNSRNVGINIPMTVRVKCDNALIKDSYDVGSPKGEITQRIVSVTMQGSFTNLNNGTYKIYGGCVAYNGLITTYTLLNSISFPSSLYNVIGEDTIVGIDDLKINININMTIANKTISGYSFDYAVTNYYSGSEYVDEHDNYKFVVSEDSSVTLETISASQAKYTIKAYVEDGSKNYPSIQTG
ncbi:MAG: hypothetical protein IJW25_03005, partial [Clostridia bacterium]|nr:hypothetical protein [Clostridia bacterium]